jgi:predicted ATPase
VNRRVELRRIAVTGGPGAGKTSLWRELARSHPGRIAAVPEVATSLLQHVFPPVQNEHERRALQRAIFEVQRSLEAVHEARRAPGEVLLCDRGTPDGAGYWPEGSDAFFAAMGTRCEIELARYDAVLFLETAAAQGLPIAHGNAVRTESEQAALAVDRRLHAVWSRHPRFHHVAVERDFAAKIARGAEVLQRWLDGR